MTPASYITLLLVRQSPQDAATRDATSVATSLPVVLAVLTVAATRTSFLKMGFLISFTHQSQKKEVVCFIQPVEPVGLVKPVSVTMRACGMSPLATLVTRRPVASRRAAAMVTALSRILHAEMDAKSTLVALTIAVLMNSPVVCAAPRDVAILDAATNTLV